jgi:3-hydroxyisobutyrate dehydrogenase-like beta-hydroxyacid dehydrogenase
MKIGVADLDKMGTAIGAASAASPATLAREVEAVITILTDADAHPQGFAYHGSGSAHPGFALPLAERTLAVYDQASREGWGGRDCTKLPAYWADRNS